MTRSEIAHLRLANQRLSTPGFEEPDQVVAFLGAVQAQDYAGAKWALAQRTHGVVDSDIERSFTEGSILRTHLLRPTWHFVTPADIRWMLELTAPHVKAVSAYYFRKLGLDEAIFARSHAALTDALGGGNELTRAELRKVFERVGIETGEPLRFGYLLFRAELDAIVCSGPRRGKQFTYALLEERVPRATARTRDEALRELTRRYFATRGPATARDYAWWSGLTMADVKQGLQMIQSDLERRVIEDQTYWFTPPAAPPPRTRLPKAYLLPNYDEYFIGFKDRSAIGERLKASDIQPLSDVLGAHIVFIDGQIVGGWKRTLASASVSLDLNLVLPLTRAEQKAVALAAERFGAFLGLPVELG